MAGEELCGDLPFTVRLDEFDRFPAPAFFRGGGVHKDQRDLRQRAVLADMDVSEILSKGFAFEHPLAECFVIGSPYKMSSVHSGGGDASEGNGFVEKQGFKQGPVLG